MHAVHKILAAASGNDTVVPGQIVTVKVDFLGVNDIYPITMTGFDEMAGKKVWDASKVCLFLDHSSPAADLTAAESQKAFRHFAREHGCQVADINRGICHNLLHEWGKSRPGTVIVITDSHTPSHGAYGAFGAGMGATDASAILIDGSTWFAVPEVVNIRFDGVMQAGIMSKDLALYALGKLGTEFATNKVIEFSGEAVQAMSMDERVCLCAMSTEMGCTSAYIHPDQTTLDDLKKHTNKAYVVHETDLGFAYEAVYEFDTSAIKPQVAIPADPGNVHDVQDYEGLSIDQVFVGSCTGGKLTDIEAVARLLKGKKVAEGTRLVVTMATKEIMDAAIEKGYHRILLDAGAALTTPGCGACIGLSSGILAEGERCASTANRNFPGRMGGAVTAEIYLVSPVTAAAVAITGKLNTMGSAVQAAPVFVSELPLSDYNRVAAQ